MRTFLALPFAMIFSVLLSVLLWGCGFHLRGVQQFPPELKKIYIQTKSPNTTMVLSLHQLLVDNGVTLVSSPKEASSILELSDVSSSEQGVSLLGAGQATMNRLTDSVTYSLRDVHTGTVVKGPEVVSFSENYSTNASLILSSNYQSSDISHVLDQKIASAIFTALTKVSFNETSTS